MGRQKEFLYDGIDLADIREAMQHMINADGVEFLLGQVARCRGADGIRIGWPAIREIASTVMIEEGILSEDAGKDQCDQLRRTMRAFLEIE